MTEVDSTANALLAGTRLTEAAASGTRLTPADQPAAEEVLRMPVVAQVSHMAALHELPDCNRGQVVLSRHLHVKQSARLPWYSGTGLSCSALHESKFWHSIFSGASILPSATDLA